jgi:CubicO group peptidase (beta-lactamase class C family)
MSNRMPRRAFLALLPVAACSRLPQSQQESLVPADLVAGLEMQIPPLLATAPVPGLSIALVRNATLVWSRGFGVTRAGSNVAVDADTVFEAGSVSKTVFAYAVMKLCEKRILDLDTPLTKYVSERWLPDPRFDQITARQVLSHTTGLPNWRSAEDPLRIQFTPGSQWHYSGEGYSFLQLVVAHLTGHVDQHRCEKMWDGLEVCATEFEAFMKANLLRPLGMSSSGYAWDDALAPRAAVAHDTNGRPTNRPRATPFSAARYGAAGNLSTTANDYARFVIEVLNPRTHDDCCLTRASGDEMIRPHVKVDDSTSWALGWQILHDPRGALIAHSGDNPGFKAYMLASVERQSGYVMFTNSDRGFDVMAKLINGDTQLNMFVRA